MDAGTKVGVAIIGGGGLFCRASQHWRGFENAEKRMTSTRGRGGGGVSTAVRAETNFG